MRHACILAASAAIIVAEAPAFATDPVRGEEIYNSRCIACHSPDANRVGPKHRGVVGRTAGTVPGYAYSKALKASKITWDQLALDRWLADPQAFLPGQRMNIRVNDPADRADLIAYLMTLK